MIYVLSISFALLINFMQNNMELQDAYITHHMYYLQVKLTITQT